MGNLNSNVYGDIYEIHTHSKYKRLLQKSCRICIQSGFPANLKF